MIIKVTEETISKAALVHAESWRESHRAICSPEFLALHTPDYHEAYLRGEYCGGKKIYMLLNPVPVGIVSVHQNLIENLYVLPGEQRKGYGARLLQFAIRQCTGTPTLWILENNQGAYRFYARYGFVKTGNRHTLSSILAEVELRLTSYNPN